MGFDPVAFNALLEKTIPLAVTSAITFGGVLLTLRAQGRNLHKQLQDQAAQKVQERLTTFRRSVYVPYVESVHKAIGLIAELPNATEHKNALAAVLAAQAETYKVQLICNAPLFKKVRATNSAIAIFYILGEDLAAPIRRIDSLLDKYDADSNRLDKEMAALSRLDSTYSNEDRKDKLQRSINALGQKKLDLINKLSVMKGHFDLTVTEHSKSVSRLAYEGIVMMRAEVESSDDVSASRGEAGDESDRIENEASRLIIEARSSLQRMLEQRG
ncbi:hypothetical protein [Xanthomonas arboricola]|uniref:hypothetical protein n=1 Tax=Xanthomonas arboricola TaxID=56448 RepID=UPI001ABA929B|nr:hypothetical protein [Xanthomonas arboricola]NIK50276.1 hypothetical protein [Xanthomonas arboricola]